MSRHEGPWYEVKWSTFRKRFGGSFNYANNWHLQNVKNVFYDKVEAETFQKRKIEAMKELELWVPLNASLIEHNPRGGEL